MLFPVLSEELHTKVGFQAVQYTFTYHSEELEYHLSTEILDSQVRTDSLKVFDDKGLWTAAEHDLCLKRTFVLNNAFFLFGENGVAPQEAEIGLAVMWTSKASNQRGTILIDKFRYEPGKSLEFKVDGSFASGLLKTNVKLQTILYLKEPGRKKPNENHLANTTGIVLGVLDETVVILDGNGSVFPIVEVKESSKPLWWVECDWVDPLYDRFDEENVKICLNKSHPHYSFLNLEETDMKSPLLTEIIANALQIIIYKAKESNYWDDIIKGKDFEPGSVAEAVYYFINTFSLDVFSPEDLAASIRVDFDVRM
mgnify:CR=1 FL=1|jgi:hypothetical protein